MLAGESTDDDVCCANHTILVSACSRPSTSFARHARVTCITARVVRRIDTKKYSSLGTDIDVLLCARRPGRGTRAACGGVAKILHRRAYHTTYTATVGW